jgi:putative transposase
MLRVSEILIELVAEALRWLRLAFRSSQSIQAENLFLRRQLALYIERGVKPRRIDPATRIALTLLSRLFDWRDALAVVRPVTLIRWYRAGWKLFWRLKSRPGRPPIPVELQALIRRIANENPSWGEERIANELLLKLGIRVSPRTVNKYLHRRPGGRPRGDLRWSTFLRLHAQGIIACDFFVAVTATFRLLHVFVVIEHYSRRLIHCNFTAPIQVPLGRCNSCVTPSRSAQAIRFDAPHSGSYLRLLLPHATQGRRIIGINGIGILTCK